MSFEVNIAVMPHLMAVHSNSVWEIEQSKKKHILLHGSGYELIKYNYVCTYTHISIT